MWDFKISVALGLMVRTLPFIVLRLLVYIGITLGYMLATGMGAGIGYGIGPLFGDGGQAGGAFWGGLIGFGLFGTFMYFIREYILYMVKAGHIAVLVEMIDGRSPPVGRSQLTYATSVVKGLFTESSILFAVDQLIKGVVIAVTGLVRGILAIFPIPGAQRFAGLLHAFLRVSLGFIDELILARMIRTGSTEPWRSAQDSLVLYGQNYKPMLKNAAWLALIIYAASLLVFLVMLVPAGLIVYFMPGTWTALTFVFALLLAWSLKAALLEPFAIACMMQVYFDVTEGQQPDPEWDARLENISKKFRKLKKRALDAGKDSNTATPSAAG